MLHQITFVGQFLLTKGLLTFVIPGFTVTDHMVVKLTFKRNVGLTDFTLELTISVDVFV